MAVRIIGSTAIVRYTGTPHHPIKPKIVTRHAPTSISGNMAAVTLRNPIRNTIAMIPMAIGTNPICRPSHTRHP